MIDLDSFIQKLRSFDRAGIAQAITLIESNKESDQDLADILFQKLLPIKSASYIIGVTGAPGVGKSCFIDVFGSKLAVLNKKIAILTYDPSSILSGGSLLGDKTRMMHLSQHKNVFIRPSPSKSTLGGLGPKTFETLQLFQALGFDYIIIESVGVGQSEIDLASLVDCFILLLAPGGGDDLQGLKKGILEFCDILLVNKADQSLREMAEQTLHDYTYVAKAKKIPLHLISALENQGIDDVIDIIKQQKPKNQKKQKDFIRHILLAQMMDCLDKKISDDDVLSNVFNKYILSIEKNALTPHQVLKDFLPKVIESLGIMKKNNLS
ncbi:MAG: methylmalonyl Co-A mutase-associated GTPase MeaB [Alphaproteobacteria bacterium]|nr:methylmalonyl Co-A mutase-associated GTPase MeaB [Alphaproteobacteria bacterium]